MAGRPPRADEVPRARADVAALLAVQRATCRPALVTASRVLGAAGEHALAWLALGAAGAAVDRPRRARWVEATGVVLTAHAASVVLKRVVRRTRPRHERLVVHSRAGHWSFPSSHAASTTAAALAFAPLLGARWTAPLAPAMALSRLTLGVHT
ncbi:MAG: phosphatase PAP2 family protein, partial [Actinomycetota bacterium]|nr:phosphatase PAP2 family protein [Actinomycetota bacterium]